ncbi:MAG: Fructose-bisphosphate aldolase class 1 [Calditrichaeota bacterium]|nr:Fructose-bisphosphate aldolase class 1 [Calditrichota bacterium]
MTDRVREILSWYTHRSPGVRANLYRILMHGRLGGTGKLVILPVDQGFEHGPLRTYLPNEPSFDPDYHPQLALDAGCSAYAAPLGFIEEAQNRFPGRLPLILKANNHDVLHKDSDPIPARTATVDDALRLGCAGVGFTIYPGSLEREEMYEQVREYIQEAHDAGLIAVVWSYPRGEHLEKDDETAVDVACYAAQIASQLGADLIKVKPPKAHIALDAHKKVIEQTGTNIDSLPDRVRLVVHSAFNGRRLVIFSGGAKGGDDKVLEEIRGIHAGGGFGSIIGRNSFQRAKQDAIKLLNTIMDIYAA